MHFSSKISKKNWRAIKRRENEREQERERRRDR